MINLIYELKMTEYWIHTFRNTSDTIFELNRK